MRSWCRLRELIMQYLATGHNVEAHLLGVHICTGVCLVFELNKVHCTLYSDCQRHDQAAIMRVDEFDSRMHDVAAKLAKVQRCEVLTGHRNI